MLGDLMVFAEQRVNSCLSLLGLLGKLQINGVVNTERVYNIDFKLVQW